MVSICYEYEEKKMNNLVQMRSLQKGSGILVTMIVAAFMVGVIALSTAKMSNSLFSGTNSNRIAVQAQEYALTRAEALRAKAYGDIDAINRRQIPNTDNYFEEVILGVETVYPSDNALKQRVCTINIYKDAEFLPRYSLKVTRVSGSGQSSLPVGSIIPWYGQIADIPNGFVLCNGSNGTPDLRNRFIVGAGNAYSLSATGGTDSVTLSASHIPSHYHYHGYNYSSNGGMWPRLATAIQPNYPSGAIATKWNGSGGGNWNGWDSGGSTYLLSNLITSLPYGNEGGTSSHENRPPYYALYYIMKI